MGVAASAQQFRLIEATDKDWVEELGASGTTIQIVVENTEGDIFDAGYLATLREIRKPGFFDALSAKTRSLVAGLKDAAKAEGVAFSADCEGGMFGFFLLDALPANYSQVMKTDSPRFNRLFHGLLDRGVYIAPALYEAGFVSAAHTQEDIAETVAIARDVFRAL